MKQLTLNNGVKIPIFGFGTYEISPDQTKQAVLSAFEDGYRLIDTAQYYQKVIISPKNLNSCNFPFFS
ncbi:aldo/keto reductase [Lactobacillus hominis]|uniref:G6F1C0 (2,5-didehydrogluconate reductase) n=1 Tax=Lactobacillus hominis DSM 23910 = CRBIP 24.179 TaxID=1423758 RepID=I7LA36_9LACO|nr:aldo/keto reductase [Lactobacillus hominis]CCI81884.1 G6F1C0 (2,5-didehydrogluconate reductase) [Lactobacillus hominis DSM 23910 = CRBIP 24.179]